MLTGNQNMASYMDQSNLCQAVTESIHTRKESFHSGHPTDIQHH